MKRTIILLMTLCLFVTAPHIADAARKKKAAKPQPDRTATMVIDAYTGAVLSQKNADAQRYPASLTKMMTLYMTFEAIRNGKLSKNDRMDVSARAASQSPSKLNVRPGGSLRVEDAILGLVTKSANDAAVVLAEEIGGSESHFGTMMTQKAKQLGMNNTRFVNASGLHNPAQVTTARDMATLGLALLRDFPNEYRYFSTKNFSYAGVTHSNHNHLMKTYQGMDGIKTGFIYASGYNLVASAKRGNRRLVGVVFGGNTAAARNKTMAGILDKGFETPANGATTNIASATAQVSTPQVKKTETKTAAAPVKAETPKNQNKHIASDYARQSFSEKVVTAGQKQAPMATNAKDPAAPVPVAQALTGLTVGKIDPSQPAPLLSDQGDAADYIDGWTVQIGAFSEHGASVLALQRAQKNLPSAIAQRGKPVVAPLMTQRGIVYRARFRNLSREQATETCQKLKDGCLILANE